MNLDYMLESVSRLSQVLSLLEKNTEGLRLSEMDVILDFNKTTLFRILSSLRQINYVAYDEDSKRYTLGNAILRMAQSISMKEEITKIAHHLIKELSEITGESVVVFKREGRFKYCVAKHDTDKAVRRIINIGEESPLLSSSSGRVITAYMDESELELLLSGDIHKLTQNTVTDKNVLLELIRNTKKDGYSISSGERLEGVVSISAPIFSANGSVQYALSIIVPEYRVKPVYVGTFVEKVKEYAQKISLLLGNK